MRANVATMLVAWIAGATALAACSGGREDPPPAGGHPRGGQLSLQRSLVHGFEPAESLTGVGAFFAPPGPAVTATPGLGTCEWGTPGATPVETPQVAWRDAGGSLTLRSAETALGLDRFDGPSGEILYLTRADASASAFTLGVSYDLEIAGSSSPQGVPPAVLPDALVAPQPPGLYSPAFSLTPLPLSRGALQLGWLPGAGGEEPALVRLSITGSAGSATLVCATEDDGFHEIPASVIEQFPRGGGTLTITRSRVSETKLSEDAWLVSAAALVEGGSVLLSSGGAE